MSKKKRKKEVASVVVELQKPQPPMRTVVDSARASKALRSDAVAKLRQDTINLFQEAVFHGDKRSHRRITPKGKSDNLQTVQRTVSRESKLRKPHLSTQVRNELQGRLELLACQERRTRKEVMFALRRTGRSGRGNKKAKWTDKSYMRCR